MLRKRLHIFSAVLGPAVLLSLLAGCAAKKPLWGGPDTGYILTYRIAPQTMLRYDHKIQSVQSMEMMGQTMESTTDNLFRFTFSGRGVNAEKNLLLTVGFDSAAMSMKAMGQDRNIDLSSIRGKSFGLILSPLGKVVAMEGADSITVDFGPMSGGKQSVKGLFRAQYPRLPDRPVKIGDSWTVEDVESTPQSGLEITTKSQTNNVLEGFETVGGEECLKVAFTTKGTVEGSGEQMGAQVAIESELESKGTWYFAYKKGVFIKSFTEIFTEGTAAITGPANMTIPVTTTSKVTFEKIM
jgi:hypothetical protein